MKASEQMADADLSLELDGSDDASPRSPLHQLGEGALLTLFGLMKNLQLHQMDNAVLKQLTDELLAKEKEFRKAAGAFLQMQIFADEFFVNTRLLRMDFIAYKRLKELMSLWKTISLGAIRFGPDVKTEDVTAFCRDAHEAIKTQSQVESKRYGDLHVVQLEDKSVDYRSFPAREAIYFFTSLMDHIEDLQAQFKEGRFPSFVPLKRLLLQLLESMNSHNQIYQMLNGLRDFRKPTPSIIFDVGVVIDALGFGVAQKSSREALLAMGVAATLTRVFRIKDSTKAIALLLRCHGIGDLAFEVVFAIHDYGRIWRSEASKPKEEQRGRARNRLGQAIALAEIYQYFVSTGDKRRSMAPSKAVVRLKKKHPPGVESGILKAFCDWKGKVPLGSPLHLSAGTLAVFLGFEMDSAQKETPVVLEFYQDGRPAALVKLGAMNQEHIKGLPKPVEVGLDLSHLGVYLSEGS